MAKYLKDWSNETSKDWAIIRQGSSYWVVPVAERNGHFVRVDEGTSYLPLTLEQRAYPQYGPYGLAGARAKYADTDPRPEYMVRVFYSQCLYHHCKNTPCKGHDMQQGKWPEARAHLHFRDWKYEKRVNQIILMKDGKQIDQWHCQQAEEASTCSNQ